MRIKKEYKIKTIHKHLETSDSGAVKMTVV